MKKLVSLIAALAMVSSLFVTTSFAAPASMTLGVDVAVADAYQIAEYEDNLAAVPAGYTLYTVTISQTGLGDFENTNSATTNAQLKKPTGFLPSSMNIGIDFGSDIANIYEDTENGFFVESDYGFGVTIVDSILSITYGPWSSTQVYPLNAKGTTTIEDGEPIAVVYLAVNGSATGTYTDQTVFAMAQFSSGSDTESTEYSEIEENITWPESIVLGSSGPTPPTPVITNPVGGKVDAVGASTDSDNLRNLQGEKVTLTQNYGAAKFSEVIDTEAKNYFLVLTDTADETVERAINFAEQGIEAGGANITFFAIVKAGSHVLKSITLKATDKE